MLAQQRDENNFKEELKSGDFVLNLRNRALLKNGKMIATIFQDAKGQGEGAVDAAIKLANGEKVEKIIDVPYQLITKDNMAEFVNRNQK